MSLYVNLISTFDETGLKKADGSLGNSEKSLENFKLKANAAFAAAGAAAATFAAKVSIDAIGAASDMNETISKSNVIFGEASNSVQKFAEDAATNLGQTKQQALDAASTFAVFGKSAGLAGQELSDFSTDFTVLASDLASFNNTTPEEAIQAIGAALRGEAEPLRKYGVLLDDATMRQKALELGLVKTTKEALTPQNKVLAAQALIYEQTKDAQGDFARTSDGLANSQRILTAELENIKISLGQALLPIVQELIPYVKGLTDAWSNLSPETQKAVLVIGVAGAAILGAVTAVVKLIAIFNTLKVTYAAITAAQLSLNLAFLTNPIFLVVAAIVALIAIFVVAYNKIDWFKKGVDTMFATIKSIVLGVVSAIRSAWDGLWSFFEKLKEPAIKIFKGIANAISAPFRTAFNLIADLYNNTIGKFKITIPDWVPIIGGKTFEFPKMPKIPQLADGGIVKARKGGVLALIGEGGRDEAVIPLPKGKRLDQAMGGTTINISVSGALDPEAVARQIETILKRSRLRAGAY